MARRKTTIEAQQTQESQPDTADSSLDKNAPFITVRSTLETGRVVLWERHAKHPNGEIFIKADQKPIEVYETSLVLLKLSQGLLERV